MTPRNPDTTMSLAEFAASARVLGALFYRAPDDTSVRPFIELIARGDLASLWPVGEPGTLQAIGDTMRAALVSPEAQQALKREHQRLFIGPDELPAPPWGSVYLEEEGTLFGETTEALQHFLAAEGVALDSGQNEPEDHIGLLFWAAALLAEEGREAALRTLLADHLLSWSGPYLQALNDATTNGFYRGLVTLTRLTLAEARRLLALPEPGADA
ncbi:Tat proofreading chaperone DmsD [Rubrivivax gelatinosus]|uniref:Twin-arginine leader-binding protein DmsD n=1 Tax=Rubrivivax gelatinosus (strain NBRC 100245 / IL144) TaxID=983917 RepID=I0HQT3_RUBGI|nr:Tat proofreading chaperone DmsD [Rubrivivax gelatinosus]BAL95370.1 twin-arginine leader-binding protein DmsD [Rubrivivax gelatinosus IL144]